MGGDRELERAKGYQRQHGRLEPTCLMSIRALRALASSSKTMQMLKGAVSICSLFAFIIDSFLDLSILPKIGSGFFLSPPVELSLGRWLFRNRWSGPLREYLVEEEIDEHARDGHVHPERPGPARNPPVLVKPFTQPAHERGQNHRHNQNSQKRVRQQNEQVDRSKPCWFKETGWATVQDIGEIAVVGQLANQEEGRSNKRGQHESAVGPPTALSDKDVAGAQEQRARPVETRIY